jgi:lipoate-protein ligase A
MAPKVRIEHEPSADGFTNMARDQELLKRAERGEAALRVYSWNAPWVSLGRFQDQHSSVVSRFENVVRRPTGGLAVLHGHDLTVAFAQPFDGQSVRDAYCMAMKPVVQSLKLCGLECRLGSDQTPRADMADCFASTSPYDVVNCESEQKVAGAAMKLSRFAFLLQVSVPYEEPKIEPAHAIRGAIRQAVAVWNWKDLGEALRTAFAPIR